MASEQEIQTGSSNVTLQFEGGERVYPCRCGKTHSGPYAAEDHAHHNCFHDGPIVWLEETDRLDSFRRCKEWDAMCLDCGKVFTLGNPFYVAEASHGE